MLRLDHPNVVECKPAPAQLIEGLVRSSPAGGPGGGVDELPLLCMEYCSGGDLRKVLNQPKNCSGLSQVEVMAVTSDIASALGDYIVFGRPQNPIDKEYQ